MTDQSKIPVPPNGEPQGKSGNSLIERAVERFDLGNFMPPPVPGKLPAGTKKLAPEQGASGAQHQESRLDPAAANPPPGGSATGVEPSSRPADEGASPEQDDQPAENMPAPEISANSPNQGQVDSVILEQAAEALSFEGPRQPVDRDRLREKGLIVPEGNVTALLEEFRIVKRQLLVQAADLARQGSGPAAQRILISSPHPGEGKTYCAVNLALSIAAEKESEVLLVDADFAEPSVPEMLGLEGGPGLMDAVTDPSANVAEFVIGTDIPGLWVLPAGNTTASDTEYLRSSRTARVLDQLTAGAPHRIVLFDSPPALAASPAAELAKYVGQVVMVVRADRTGQGALDDAISLLSACPNIQLLLNAVHFSPSGRKFGKYYGHGK